MVKTRRWFRKKRKIVKGGRIRLSADRVENLKKTKKMKCNPAMDKMQTVTDHSCLTKDALKKIAHNHKMETNYKNPGEIWNQLYARLYSKCHGNERCWLNDLPNKEKELLDKLFKPQKPKEWSKNPNTWLNNIDIEKVLHQYEEKTPFFKLLGPTPIDFDKVVSKPKTCVENSLCHFELSHYLKKGVTKIGIVFNTDPHTKGGSHWISLFIDLQDKFMMFFDSTGNKMPPEVNTFMERVQTQANKIGMTLNVYHNHNVEHQQGGSECGMYTLFFIITMLIGQTEFHPQKMNAQQKVDLFLKNFEIPDEYVQKYRDVYFA
jgi:hypothetical protein